jgi:hypothetical protein
MKKATLIACGVLLAGLFAASPAKAQCCFIPPPTAPDACGPGYYCQNYCGQWYGPNYNVYPPFQPFNGMVFAPANNTQARFPTHPFARGPRDLFMWVGK